MDVATISGAISALNGARDIVKSLLAMHTTTEVEAKIQELRSAIFEAQDKTQTARDELDAMRRQLEDARRVIEALTDHRKFVATLTRSGGAYLAEGDPDPYCPRCIEASTRPIHLLKTERLELRQRVWRCPECKTEMTWQRPS